MIHALGAHITKHPYLLITLFLILVALSGSGANALIMFMNDGKMPIAMHREDIFFSMASDTFTKEMFVLIESGGIMPSDFDTTHTALTPHTSLSFLGDRIIAYIPGTAASFLPEWTNPLLWHTWFPRYARGGTISIGDILQWTGLTLLIFWVCIRSVFALCLKLLKLIVRK